MEKTAMEIKTSSSGISKASILCCVHTNSVLKRMEPSNSLFLNILIAADTYFCFDGRFKRISFDGVFVRKNPSGVPLL